MSVTKPWLAGSGSQTSGKQAPSALQPSCMPVSVPTLLLLAPLQPCAFGVKAASLPAGEECLKMGIMHTEAAFSPACQEQQSSVSPQLSQCQWTKADRAELMCSSAAPLRLLLPFAHTRPRSNDIT